MNDHLHATQGITIPPGVSSPQVVAPGESFSIGGMTIIRDDNIPNGMFIDQSSFNRRLPPTEK